MSCADEHSCETCADAAVAMRVLELAAPPEPARCAAVDGTVALVALDLVEASVGDEVLVHAGVAIALAQRREEAP